jgi:hypothetical protein
VTYLDEPLGIPLGELRSAFEGSARELLEQRGCPPARLVGQVMCAVACGQLLFQRHGDAILTRRVYADVVERSVSWAMESGKLVS